MAATDYTQVVQQLYISYFGRPADPTGLANFTAQLFAIDPAAGTDAALTTTTALSAYSQAHPTSAVGQLVGSFANKVTPPGNDHLSILKFVNDVYNNIFHRDADEGGNFWVNAIETGSVSRENAALAITEGAMTNQSTQGLADAALVANVNAVAKDFTASLDTIAKVISFSGDAAANAIGALLKQVTATTDLTAFHANVVSAIDGLNVPVVVTSTLTTGLDTIAGTGAVATVNGTFNGTGATFATSDSITGGTGKMTVNLIDLGSGAVGSLPVLTTVQKVDTVNVTSAEAATVNATATGWNTIGNLNVTTNSGGANGTTVTASGTTVTTVTDTATAATAALTVNGGSAVNVTQTNSDGAVAKLLGSVSVGAGTAATGAVTVSVTETNSNVASGNGNITVAGGTTTTVNSTVNAAVAIAAATGTVAAGKAGTIAVTGGTGAVVVNNTTNVTDTAADVIVGNTISVTGGSSVVVNNVSTSSAGAAASALASVVDGAVTVLDGGTSTNVTVNNQATTAVAATAAVPASAAIPGAAGGPGFSAGATTPAVSAAAAIPGVLGVTAGNVSIAGATAGHLLANSSNTITTATVNNYATGYINSSVLKTLTLSGAGAGFTIDNVGTTPLTALALNVNALVDATGLTINNNGITTLNVTTGGAGSSSLASITDTALTTLNIAGSQTLKLTTVTPSLTTIAVTGAAGFNGDVSGLGAQLTSFTTTSSGTITATVDDLTQTFVGSTGRDVITIAGDATKVITGGSATNNELILSAISSTYTAAKTGVKVTGFTTLGVSDNAATHINVYDMKNVFTGFNALDVVAGPTGVSSTAFTNVKSGTTLAIDASVAGSGNVAAVEGAVAASILYQVADATGNTDTLNLTLGTASTAGITVAGLMLEDANAVGLGTLNIVSNGTAANTITTLIDNGLHNLNVSGAKGLTIGTLNEATTQATSFSINNTSSGSVAITNFTDANLGSLTFSGNHNSSITNLLGVTGHIVTIANTGTGTATIGAFADASLTTLTLTGNVKLNGDASPLVASAATGATTGVTVAAGTDNAHINLNLTGAVAGATDSITVGNANNFITDGSTAGTVNVTVGSGANYIDLHTGANNATYAANVTLGAHTNTSTLFNEVLVSVTGSQTAGYATTVTGAAKGDVLQFVDAGQSVVVTLSAAQQTAITNAVSLSAAITLAFADTGAAHNVAAFTYGGDTYVIDNVAADTAFTVGTDSIVHIVGSHTIAAVTAAGAATVSFAS